MDIRRFKPAHKGLKCGELVELGRRLTEEQLQAFGLMDPVIQAEKEAYWRFQAGAELVSYADPKLSEQLKVRAERLAAQLESPKRGSAKHVGGTAQGRRRRLPPAGTLLVKRHAFQGYNAPRIERPDGRTVINRFVTFKFLVIHERGELLLLGDKKDRVHRSPSAAARAATGNSAEKGWAFFDIT